VSSVIEKHLLWGNGRQIINYFLTLACRLKHLTCSYSISINPCFRVHSYFIRRKGDKDGFSSMPSPKSRKLTDASRKKFRHHLYSKFQMRSHKHIHLDIITDWPEHQRKLNPSHTDQDKYWKQQSTVVWRSTVPDTAHQSHFSCIQHKGILRIDQCTW
jgi:hypothetical protein